LTLISGDAEARVEPVARVLGIDAWQATAAPASKLDSLAAAQGRSEVVAMVGDGLNDAPVLARADVSFAFAHGAAVNRLHADVVLLGERLLPVADAVRHARQTLRVIRQNLTWAAVYNAACIPLALGGWLPPWLAGLGMAASSLLVVGNALRVARVIEPGAA
jgi:Cu2+-exporting ATPase